MLKRLKIVYNFHGRCHPLSSVKATVKRWNLNHEKLRF